MEGTLDERGVLIVAVDMKGMNEPVFPFDSTASGEVEGTAGSCLSRSVFFRIPFRVLPGILEGSLD